MTAMGEIFNRDTRKVFEEMQKLETREEMIEYLRSLPRKEEDI